MRSSIRIAAMAAVVVGAANLAMGQGPIREGLRSAGEATANVARGVAQGTANVARGVGDAAVGTVRATGDAIGLTPATPYQARGGDGFDTSRDARWRFSRHNGEWWYYNDNDQWMYHRDGEWQQFSQDNYQPLNQNQQFAQGQQLAQGQQFHGQHTAGFRGVDQSAHHSMHQQVRHDHHGRAYICENGRPVYLDQGQFHSQGQVIQDQSQFAPTPAQPQEHSALRQDLDHQNADPSNLDQQAQPPSQPVPSNQAIQSDAAVTAPATSNQISGDAGGVAEAPAGPNTSTQTQSDPAAPREINNNPTSQTQGAVEHPNQ